MARNGTLARRTIHDMRGYAISLVLLFHVAYGQNTGGKKCDLSEDIRPVVYAQGFQGSLLFDSSNKFTVEFFDELDFSPKSPDNGGLGDLNLPLTWDASNLTQTQSPVGPEGSANDIKTGLAGLEGAPTEFIRGVRFYSFLYLYNTAWRSVTGYLRGARSTPPQRLHPTRP